MWAQGRDMHAGINDRVANNNKQVCLLKYIMFILTYCNMMVVIVVGACETIIIFCLAVLEGTTQIIHACSSRIMYIYIHVQLLSIDI